MTRNGKVARLPRQIREQLNRRLQDGEPGTRLVEWLNSLPEVQKVMASEFGGLPLREQNLSEWKQGGYEDWVRHQEARDGVRQLAEQAWDLTLDADEEQLSDCLSVMLAAELAQAARQLLADTTDPKERWQRLQGLLHQLAQLRRGDHRAGLLQLKRERWEQELERILEEKRKAELQAAKDHALAPLWAHLKRGGLAEVFGGGEKGREIADFIIAVQNDLPLPREKPVEPSGNGGPTPLKPNPTESGQIKPENGT